MTKEHTSRRHRRLTATVTDLEVRVQRAFLIGVETPDTTAEETERSIEELTLLTDTAGSKPVDQEIVIRQRIDPATYIGSGKAEELASLTGALDIDVVVFDNSLTPAQQRNLQKLFGCDVVDREALILDIFAQHATSKVGALQVEMALLRYHLPRLSGQGKVLSQQGAGIGTRGPGETKLETDRRRILQRISKLKRELKNAARHRATQRKSRKRSQIPQVAIVGYTNAGKSTLLNALTDAGVLVQDQLFATLDSTVRRLKLPNSAAVLLADTVGFVRRLPHHLVDAFQSTLAEVTESDLLIHVVDGAEPHPEGHIAAVHEVLREIGAAEIPELVVFNKSDLVSDSGRTRLASVYPESLQVSALNGDGLEAMLEEVSNLVQPRVVTLTLEVPYDRGDVVAAAHRIGEVVAEKHDDEGTILEVRVPEAASSQFDAFSQ